MHSPFLEVIKSLNSHKVKYVVIGGNAAIYYGVARGTFDLDLLIEATKENAEQLMTALKAIRFGTAHKLTAERLLSNEITTFNDWIPVDVQTRTPGVRFATAWKNREVKRFRSVSVPFLSRRDLIRAKRAAGRPVDLENVRLLQISKKR